MRQTNNDRVVFIHGKKKRAPIVRLEQWMPWRPLIERLYLVEHKTQEEIVRFLNREEDFPVKPVG
jgi:hypothetical protein